MTLKPPQIHPTLVVSDDPFIAAQISALIGKRGYYLPVVDGPRLQRHDAEAELIRRNNAAARMRAQHVILAGLDSETQRQVKNLFPDGVSIIYSEDISLPGEKNRLEKSKNPLIWGRSDIGAGLLTALREDRSIDFRENYPTCNQVTSVSGHLVIVESGEPLTEVIAANYAFSVGAGIQIIPSFPNEYADSVLEQFYNLNIPSDISQTQKLIDIKSDLRSKIGKLDIPQGGSITFITRSIPLGFAYQEVPSTHLFQYPDIGINIINGFSAEIERTPIAVAAFVDPQEVEAPEIQEAVNTLYPRGVFARHYIGPTANVRDISSMVENFPYDLLVFATHCGDSDGSRCTYEFVDSEGQKRRLVVDTAFGVGRPGEDGRLPVTEYFRFRELDGVPWMDPHRWKDFKVGSAIKDWLHLTSETKELQPILRESISRVKGVSALKMSDQNYLVAPHSIANQGSPIILNNACTSWHNLSLRFVFAGARAYIGCLVEVTGSEAYAVTKGLFGKHIDKFLPHALWASQREAYGDSPRRPYVVTGVYTQRIRTLRNPRTPYNILRSLKKAQSHWESRVRSKTLDEKSLSATKRVISYIKSEISHFEQKLSSGRFGPPV